MPSQRSADCYGWRESLLTAPGLGLVLVTMGNDVSLGRVTGRLEQNWRQPLMHALERLARRMAHRVVQSVAGRSG